MPFFSKDFSRCCGLKKSRDLICICHHHKNDKICQLITLPKFEVGIIKALDDGPPPKFVSRATEEPCLNFLNVDWWHLCFMTRELLNSLT